MKQKIVDDAPVTKKELKEVLKKDFKNFETRFEKKIDQTISKRLNEGFAAFRQEVQYMFKLQDERWERRFLAFESRMYTLVDPLLKEIETRQQDRELTAGQIADLDRRVTKLEHSK